MMCRISRLALLAGLQLAATTVAIAQDSTGTVGCAALAQAASNGITSRVGADDTTVNAPQSVKQLTCMGDFFSGVGLDLITNLVDPSKLILALEGQICDAVKSSWSSSLGGAQCGLTITGFNLGFGGLGGGLSCPKLSFGGGGPPIATVGIGVGSGGTGLYIPGTTMPPTGYSTDGVRPGTF